MELRPGPGTPTPSSLLLQGAGLPVVLQEPSRGFSREMLALQRSQGGPDLRAAAGLLLAVTASILPQLFAPGNLKHTHAAVKLAAPVARQQSRLHLVRAVGHQGCWSQRSRQENLFYLCGRPERNTPPSMVVTTTRTRQRAFPTPTAASCTAASH